MSKLLSFFKSCPTPNTPISDEDSREMNYMLINPDFREPWNFEEFKERLIGPNRMFKDKNEMHQGLWVIWVRSHLLNDYFKMTLGASLFMSLFVTSVGDAAMYFSYVTAKAKEHGFRIITLDFLAKQVFQFGVFTPEQISLMWSLQKEDGKNLIDSGEEWRMFLYGDVEGKVAIRFSDDDQRLVSTEEVLKTGIRDAREIDGRMFFWLGKKYVSTSIEEYSNLEKK